MKKIVLSVIISMLLTVQSAFAGLAEDLGTIVVSATRGEQKSYKIAGNVTVITQDQIQASNAQTVPDVLKEALGVYVSDNNTVKSSIVDIRGFGDSSSRNVLVLVNGRKINNVDISGPDLIQIPVDAVERIEIIRGASSVLYGDNAVGGVVNIITRKGKGKLSGKIGGTFGSYDANSVDGEISGAWKDAFSYYLYSQYLDKRGYRDNSDLLAKDFQTRFGYDLGENYGVDFNVGWHEDVQELPGGLTASELETLGRKATSPNHKDDTSYTTDRYFQMTLNATPWPEDAYYGEFVTDFYYRNRDVYDEFNGFSFPFHTKRNIDTIGVTSKYIFNRNVFNRDVNFITGVDFYTTDNDIFGSANNTDDLTISKNEWGFFGFLEHELFSDVFINGGTRYHQAEYTFEQRNFPLKTSQRPDEWVSMGGVKYEYAKGSNIHLNAQQTFRFLATDEWYSSTYVPGFVTPGLNTFLDQQRGIQYEAGIKHNFNDKVIATVTPYWIFNKHEIYFNPTTFANTNYDKTRRIGVEFGSRVDLLSFLDLDFLSKFEFFTNYNYQRPQFVKGAFDDKDIPHVPRHQASAGILFGFLDHYNLSLTERYVGGRYPINDLNNAAPILKPYYLLDLKLAYEADNVEVFAAINNLANEKYYSYVSVNSSLTSTNYFPAAERNFTAGVNIKF